MDQKTKMTGLEALLQRGPTPRYAIRAKVLAHWAEIEAARLLPCTWAEIAAAMGLREDQWRSVWRAYHKISKDYGGPPPKPDARPHPSEKVAEKAMVTNGKNIKLDM